MPPLFGIVKDWQEFGIAVVYATTFGLLGIVLLIVGFKAFERVTPHLNVEKKLEEGSIAVGIVIGALLLAIGIIVAVAIA